MSKATQGLSDLMSINIAASEMEDTQEALARTDEMRDSLTTQTSPAAGKDGKTKASSGVPTGIFTGVLASVVLGPVGGILIGGALGWGKKKEEQKMLDKISANNTLLKASDDVYSDNFDRMKASATSDRDLEQIGMIKGLHTMARDKLLSADPETAAMGGQMMQGVDSASLQFFNKQETEETAKKANDARLKVELNDRQYDQHTGLLANFDDVSAGFETMNTNMINMMGALQGGTPSDLYAATAIGQKVLDPTGVVKPEDQAAFAKMGGWLERVEGMILGAKNGVTLTEDQRIQIGDTFMRMNDENIRAQLQREAEYSDRVLDANLPVKYHNNYRKVKHTPAAQTPDIPTEVIENNVTPGAGGSPEATKEATIQSSAKAWEIAKKAITFSPPVALFNAIQARDTN